VEPGLAGPVLAGQADGQADAAGSAACAVHDPQPYGPGRSPAEGSRSRLCSSFLDDYANAQGFASRSAVVHKAVRLLRAAELGPAYEDAWNEWSSGDEAEAWDATAHDGLG
jgi:hypothetical protein